MFRFASLVLLATLSTSAFASGSAAATSPEVAAAVARIAAADGWDGDRVGYSGEHTDVRKAWETLVAKASTPELVAWVTQHSEVSVRYAALRALEQRDAIDQVPDWVMADEAPLRVCPGGCMCVQESVGSRLRDLHAGNPRW